MTGDAKESLCEQLGIGEYQLTNYIQINALRILQTLKDISCNPTEETARAYLLFCGQGYPSTGDVKYAITKESAKIAELVSGARTAALRALVPAMFNLSINTKYDKGETLIVDGSGYILGLTPELIEKMVNIPKSALDLSMHLQTIELLIHENYRTVVQKSSSTGGNWFWQRMDFISCTLMNNANAKRLKRMVNGMLGGSKIEQDYAIGILKLFSNNSRENYEGNLCDPVVAAKTVCNTFSYIDTISKTGILLMPGKLDTWINRGIPKDFETNHPAEFKFLMDMFVVEAYANHTLLNAVIYSNYKKRGSCCEAPLECR
jgi:hypothetical protein